MNFFNSSFSDFYYLNKEFSQCSIIYLHMDAQPYIMEYADVLQQITDFFKFCENQLLNTKYRDKLLT